ncbi:MAG: hypothetical protein KGJ80_04045 [Chloroflexota bacterium]|nr:hypothetical protein [Chloroflexota bacterium]
MLARRKSEIDLQIAGRDMRFKAIVLLTFPIVLGLWVVSSATALACDPFDFDSPANLIWCDVRARTPTPPPPPPTPAAVVVAAKPVSATTRRSGDSPANALELSDENQVIDAGARLWYKIGSDGSHMDVWMATYGQSGLGFVVYAPNQLDIQSPDTKPKGVGTYPNSDPNTLRWSGGSFMQRGTWYALVTNNSTFRLWFKFSSNQFKVEKNCFSYWEYLPDGQYVYWTACS